jgi:epoxyqueuosine reductase
MSTHTIDQLSARVRPHGLFVMGFFCENDETLVLIGADKGFWEHFKQSPEFSDTLVHPIDRWSKQLLTKIATEQNGSAVFPSDGPPFAPFIAWATQSGRFWQSPTGMLVHDTAGLMISIRGAIKLPFATRTQPTRPNPCDSCVERPCAVACPISALSAEHFYDVPKCKTYLGTPQGSDCMSDGCHVRQICPISQSFNRPKEQSAFHMNAFMGIKNSAK